MCCCLESVHFVHVSLGSLCQNIRERFSSSNIVNKKLKSTSFPQQGNGWAALWLCALVRYINE